jgi:GT2 family glycosyltransferase
MTEIFVITPVVNRGVLRVESSIHSKTVSPHRVIHTNISASGVVNRNWALDHTFGEFAVSLDNDVLVLTDNWLELMLDTIRGDSRIAVVGGKIVLPGDRIHSCGTGFDLRSYCLGDMDIGQREFAEEVPAITSTAYLYRRSVFDSIRFDERFTGSGAFSDTDICLRLRKAGWKCYYDGRVKFLHLKPQTNGKWWEWNHLYFHFKHPKTIFTQARGNHVENLVGLP